MTRDELMAASYRLEKCARYDGPGAVRTGREWFNRYMIFPWERPSDFRPTAPAAKPNTKSTGIQS